MAISDESNNDASRELRNHPPPPRYSQHLRSEDGSFAREIETETISGSGISARSLPSDEHQAPPSYRTEDDAELTSNVFQLMRTLRATQEENQRLHRNVNTTR